MADKKKACRKCAFCGKHFIAHTANQKYCATLCRLAADGRRQPDAEWRKGRNCVICGEFFFPRNSQQKTCSFSCSEKNAKRLQYKWHRRGQTTEPPEPVDSAECGYDIGYSRVCHDCGKPTNDYRCSKCRRKWFEKNKDHCV